MKVKKPLSVLLILVLLLTCSPLAAVSVSAISTQVGKNTYSYTLYKGKATITKATASGDVVIPSSLDGYQVVAIGDDAFSNCTYTISSLTIPDCITSIGNRAFAGVLNMSTVKIGSGVTTIGDYAFKGCRDLMSVKIGNSVTSIGNYAFSGCSYLSSLTIGEKVSTIGEGAFRYCAKLVSVTIPDSIETIGNYSFANCEKLKSVRFGNGIKTIGDYAFYNSCNLASVDFPDSVVSIGYSAFEGSGIYTVDFGKGLKTIENQAFLGCTYLSSVIIPDEVTTIGASAFSECYNVKTIKIPDSVAFIGSQAFNNTAYYNNYDENWENDALYIGNHLLDTYNDISGDYKIKDGTKTISEYAFYNCSALTSISIPDSVSVIECSVFRGCSSLTTVTIPKSVTAIGDYAFYDCKNLKTVYILGILSSFGDYVFDECYNLTDAYYVGTREQSEALLRNAKSNMYGVNRTWHSRYVPPCKEHTYAVATCTKAKTCKVCGATSGKALGHTYTNACDASCNVCNAVRTINHTYKTITTKATTSKDGKSVTACTVCKTISTTKPIPKVTSFKLSATSYTYNGKVLTPTVTVKDSKGKVLKNGTDYTVKYDAGRKNPGKYTVTVILKGNYTGNKPLTFTILPGKTSSLTFTQTESSIKATWKAVTGASGYKVTLYSAKNKAIKTVYTTKPTYTFSKLSKGTTYKVRVTAYKTVGKDKLYASAYTQLTTATKPGTPTLSATAGTKKATLKWNKQTGATGYEVYMSTSKSGKYSKIATLKGNSKISYTKTGLTKGNTYYFKVAAYKTVDGKNIYGASSAVKSAKIK